MKEKGGNARNWEAAIVFAIFAMGVVLASCPSVFAADLTEAQGIVDKARITFNDFIADENYSWLHENLKNAKGLLIFPQVLKAGFFIGGSGGTGVLMVKGETGDWSQPAFYTMGSMTFGLQIGGEAAEVVMMVMRQKGIDSLYTSSFKLGGDTSAAAGPYGIGAKGNVTADFISFAKSKGIYAGLNLEGSVIEVREKLNKAYYGKAVSPVDIIVKKAVNNKGSAELRAAVKRAGE